MAGVTFDSQPTRILKAGVTVMLERTADELPAIQRLAPAVRIIFRSGGGGMRVLEPVEQVPHVWRRQMRADDSSDRHDIDGDRGIHG
jgi:hypothetical protein